MSHGVTSHEPGKWASHAWLAPAGHCAIVGPGRHPPCATHGPPDPGSTWPTHPSLDPLRGRRAGSCRASRAGLVGQVQAGSLQQDPTHLRRQAVQRVGHMAMHAASAPAVLLAATRGRQGAGGREGLVLPGGEAGGGHRACVFCFVGVHKCRRASGRARPSSSFRSYVLARGCSSIFGVAVELNGSLPRHHPIHGATLPPSPPPHTRSNPPSLTTTPYTEQPSLPRHHPVN